jgi:hypothetical protein
VGSRVTLTGESRNFVFEVRFTRSQADASAPPIFHALASEPQVKQIEWHMPH